MHQLGRNTITNIKSNINTLKKFNKYNQQQEEKIQGWIPQQEQKQKIVAQSILTKIKKRTFSLSKLQSVRQSDLAQQLQSSSNNKKQAVKRLQNKKNDHLNSLSQKVIFQKLNLSNEAQQKQHISGINFRRNNKKSLFFNKQDSTKQQEQLDLLKQIVKKKEDDLIINKTKQHPITTNKPKCSTKQYQPQQLLQNQNNPHSNAIKRIKLLKKTKQYQFYDNIVHSLLNNIQKYNEGTKDHIFKENTETNTEINDQSLQISNKNIRSKSLSNISANLTIKNNRNESIKYNTSTNFSNNSQFNSQINLSNSTKNPSLLQKRRQSMIFRLSDLTSDNIYQKKITSFIEFLYKVNFSNSIYVNLSLTKYNKKPIKVFIGRGNNCQLVKSVLKRRFWLQITTNKVQANFVWTQDTQKQIHTLQLQNKESQNFQNTQNSYNNSKPRNYSLKNKFTSPSYSQQSNNKILPQKQIQQANSLFSRSYLGLKSPFSQVNICSVTNHIPNNSIIGSKKALFKLMHFYYSQMLKIDPFIFLPHTYHIIPGQKQNQGIIKFKSQQLHKKQRIWIVKPGQNTNRGNGISVATTNQIQKLMRYKKFHKNGQPKTYIVQKYLKPFLYNSRKFDIRHYLLITSVNGIIKGYWYNSGYIRTSSEKFDLDELDNEFIHLTNDAIQKHSQNYGKYQQGNKLSYSTFQRYLDNNVPHKKYDFQKLILQQMKKITTDVLRASFMFLDPDRSERLSKGKGTNFELYGMDFMIDHKFKPYLIQINANPCLEISCPLLERIIPIAIEHTLRLALDPLFPPNEHYSPSKRYQLCDKILDRLKFELIFDQKTEGKQLKKQYKLCSNKFQLNGVCLQPEQDLFQDDGQEIKDDKIFQQVKQ